MSMYAVNCSVPKTLVRHLVRYYADTSEEQELKEVLLDILDTPVSPELLPPVDGVISQKTEDLVGPYELHDFFLYYMLRFGFHPEKIFRLTRQAFGEEYDVATCSAGVSLHSILRDPASRMDPRLVLLRFHREGICECQVMQVLLCG